MANGRSRGMNGIGSRPRARSASITFATAQLSDVLRGGTARGRSGEPDGTLFEPPNCAKLPSKLIPLLLAYYDELARTADLLTEQDP